MHPPPTSRRQLACRPAILQTVTPTRRQASHQTLSFQPLFSQRGVRGGSKSTPAPLPPPLLFSPLAGGVARPPASLLLPLPHPHPAFLLDPAFHSLPLSLPSRPPSVNPALPPGSPQRPEPSIQRMQPPSPAPNLAPTRCFFPPTTCPCGIAFPPTRAPPYGTNWLTCAAAALARRASPCPPVPPMSSALLMRPVHPTPPPPPCCLAPHATLLCYSFIQATCCAKALPPSCRRAPSPLLPLPRFIFARATCGVNQ